jgi:hypothetical protein
MTPERIFKWLILSKIWRITAGSGMTFAFGMPVIYFADHFERDGTNR